MSEQPKLQPLPEDWERALAVVAHPDDLEYGAASAIARWTSQGKRIAYLMVTRGETGIDSMPPAEVGPLRVQEELNSAAVVGVDTVESSSTTATGLSSTACRCEGTSQERSAGTGRSWSSPATTG